MDLTTFISEFEKLPVSIQKEFFEYFEKLKSKALNPGKTAKGFSFKWENDLSELKNDFTSVELQHQINQYR